MTKIGHARSTENHDTGWNGKAVAGDQNENEVSVTDWYNKPWTSVFRANDVGHAEVIAQTCEKACANDLIGYDQSERLTLYHQAVKVNFDLSKVTEPCECDCSSLVAVCVLSAGISVPADFRTATELNFLKRTGKFTILTSADVLNNPDNLRRGDILLGDGHTAIVLTDGVNLQKNSSDPEKTIWNFLKNFIVNDYGVAGMMGNLFAESSLIPNNLQNSFNTKFGVTDAEYTAQVDAGTRNFIDGAGYGLPQWTFYTRKKAFLDYAKSKGSSIGNLQIQLEFLQIEMQGEFSGLLKTLQNAKSVREASNAVLTVFEQPADMGEAVQAKRASYSQTYFDKYGKTPVVPTPTPTPAPTPVTEVKSTAYSKYYDKNLAGSYVVTADLNIRNDAGTSHKILGVFKKDTVVKNYGYFNLSGDVRWLYVQATVNGVKYTGYCSSKYLRKKG